MSDKETKDKITYIRLTPSQYRILEELAAAENRSASGQASHFVIQALLEVKPAATSNSDHRADVARGE